jgi:glycosyltransferase involved in cell wall biosynthesis
MRAAVARHLANGETDLCQIEFCGYLYTTASYGGPRVLQAHNVESTIWRRFAENESSAARRWFMRRQHDKYLKYEGWAFRDVERVVAVSRTDAETIASLYGDLPVDVVDNGVDVAAFGSVQRQPDPHRILFLGALDWRPNQDAVDWLLTEIFPAVRREVPQAELTIVGRHPPASLVQRAAEAVGIHLFADVPDVRPHLAASAVMSVPLRIGGGSRLKILESLAAGVPVVSTQVGAEGLNLVNDVHLTVADSGEHHARALIEALSTPARYEMQAAAGRAEVAETYGWPRLAERLERSWESARARRNPHRSRAAAEASEVANPLD